MKGGLSALMFFLAALTIVPGVFGQPLDCTANPDILKNTLASITNPLDAHSFTISGTCNGTVVIRGFRDLTIDGSGTGWLVGVNYSKEVKVHGATLQNGGSGLLCDFGSWCWTWDTDFRNINGYAIHATSGSLIDVGMNSLAMLEPVTITDCGIGIAAEQRSQVNLKGIISITLMKPMAVGLAVNSSQMRTETCNGSKQISGTRQAVSVNANGEFLAGCPLTIENNQVGISVISSLVYLGPDVAIRNNGVAGQTDVAAGVFANHGSTVQIGGAKVVSNLGIGVHLMNNSTASVTGNPEIRDNAGFGMVVTQRSALLLLPGPTSVIGNNGTTDLQCTVQGTAYGRSSAIAKKRIDCKSFEEMP